ncbi:transposase [Rhodococcus sp. ACS1]|uniref:transposase n=1 Tax=Rhodococcus sp. ACS1 TaxID=2028570 RepID=UPI00359C8066
MDTWSPEINAFLSTGITNARTERYNRLVKAVKRAGCGFRNRENSRPPDTLPLHPQIAGRDSDFMLIAWTKLKSPDTGTDFCGIEVPLEAHTRVPVSSQPTGGMPPSVAQPIGCDQSLVTASSRSFASSYRTRSIAAMTAGSSGS